MQRVYDPETGELTTLVLDLDGDRRFDTWSYWEDGRRVRREIDDDQDGPIDRWQIYGPEDVLVREGFSTAGDGTLDAWRYFRDDGDLARIEYLDAGRDRVSSVVYYRAGARMRLEEDTDEDGVLDRRTVFFDDPNDPEP